MSYDAECDETNEVNSSILTTDSGASYSISIPHMSKNDVKSMFFRLDGTMIF